MKEYPKEQIASAIMNKALELGASQAGICSLADLIQAPSYKLAPFSDPSSASKSQPM